MNKKIFKTAAILVLILIFLSTITNTTGKVIGNIEAMIEAKTLKPLPIPGHRGNCRIVNMIQAIKNKKVYIVLGKIQFNGKIDNHLWVTNNPYKPAIKEYIIDNAVDKSYTKNKEKYIAKAVLKLNDDCSVDVVKFDDNMTFSEKGLYEKYISYISMFCTVRKSL